MSEPGPELIQVSPGVARVELPAGLSAEEVGRVVDQVRRAVAHGFEDGHSRVEMHVAPEDRAVQRLATTTGLRKEGIARGVAAGEDRIVYARLADDVPVDQPGGFRALLNSFLPRKRAIAQQLIRDTDGRVLICRLTYKRDQDLPGGVVEVGEAPRLAAEREVSEELGLDIAPGRLLLTDWLPPWGGWDDAVCLVFDGGVHDPRLTDGIVRQAREIAEARFLTVDQARDVCADFTTRRLEAALASLDGSGPPYTESGR